MADLGAWLAAAPAGPATAFASHVRLTAIHPFADGNGRTARLLMNLVLLRLGYPPVAVRPEDRLAYLDALERGSHEANAVSFQTLMHDRLDATLGAYLDLLRQTLPPD